MGKCYSRCFQPGSIIIPIQAPITKASHTSTIDKPTRYIENCLVIWLFDELINKFDNVKNEIIHNICQFKEFTNLELCLDFIQTIHDERLFLITSIKYRSMIDFSQFQQIESTYVLDPSQSIATINQFCPQLQQDIDLCETDLIYFSAISNSSNIYPTKEMASFVFIQLLNEIMMRFKFESSAKDVWFDFCREQYAHHPEQLQMINDYACHYRPYQTLDLLKRHDFMWKILNRVRRTFELDILYKIGFFGKQMNINILRLYEEQKDYLPDISIVYRGKTMLMDEYRHCFENQSKDFVTFSHDLIATFDKQEAIDFIHQRLLHHSNFVGILFEIYVEKRTFNEDRPYTLIRNSITSIDRIYFSAGTVFHIETLEQNLSVKLIKLKMISKNDPQINRLLVPFRTKDLSENPLTCLGKLLIDMGEYQRAEQLSLEMLNDPSIQTQPYRIVRLHNGLGGNYVHKGNYSTALHHYQKALEISRTYLPSDHSDLILLYKNIGNCYYRQNQFNLALKNYEEAHRLISINIQTLKSPLENDLQNLIYKTKQMIVINEK